MLTDREQVIIKHLVEAYIDNGREKTNLDVIKWVKQVQDLGVGEILLTSVDKDGTESGLDEELIDEVSNRTNVSLIVSGGIGKPEHFQNCIKNFKVTIFVAVFFQCQQVILQL